MKILGICGSPRRGGNTELLLDRALSGARGSGARVKKIVLSELRFSPCLECARIKKDGTCRIKDGLTVLYRELDAADAVILASPIFFGSVSAQTKMMIDRFQCRWKAKYVFKTVKQPRNGKKGVFLCVSGTHRKDFFENAKAIVRNFFATADIAYTGDVFCGGVEDKGDIVKKRDCLNKAEKIGVKISRNMR